MYSLRRALFFSRGLFSPLDIYVNSQKMIDTRLFHLSNPLSSMYEKRERDKLKRQIGKSKFEMKTVRIEGQMSVRELANAMEKTPIHVFDCLDQIGHPVRQRRDSYLLNDAQLIIKIIKLSGMRYSLPRTEEKSYDSLIDELELKNESISSRAFSVLKQNLIRRPPCVTIMGHVDHGKTTLLDALRGTNVVDEEYGGITQHIGAFNCKLKLVNEQAERSLTFLDTPGHAAYSMMRSRGAKCTDIIVLVIAAEDSIMEQTVESIKHAQESGCKIIVAINKIDRASEKQLQKCKNDLLQYGLIPEEMGGEVQVVPISALKKINLDLLKEEIWAQAEIMDLKGDPKGLVEGYIIESTQDIYKGKIATVLIKRGTLRKGSYLVAGNTWCKVKSLCDENLVNINQASLSQAVQVMGWKDLPNAGDEVLEFEKENLAKNLIELRLKIEALKKLKKEREIIEKKRKDYDDLYQIKSQERREKGLRFIHDCLYDKNGEIINLNKKEGTDDKKQFQPKIKHIILKTDVNGSLEAILNVLETYDCNHKVILEMVHFEVGQIKKTDLEMAETFGATIYCFNLCVDQLEKNIQNKKIQIKHFNIIYQLFDDLKEELNRLAPLEEEEHVIGEAQVQECFSYDENNTKTIAVAGSRCTEGVIDKKMYFKLMRNDEILQDRIECHSLKHVKTEINTVKKNVEFGISFKELQLEVKRGDKIVCYDIKMVKSPIEWNLGF